VAELAHTVGAYKGSTSLGRPIALAQEPNPFMRPTLLGPSQPLPPPPPQKPLNEALLHQYRLTGRGPSATDPFQQSPPPPILKKDSIFQQPPPPPPKPFRQITTPFLFSNGQHSKDVPQSTSRQAVAPFQSQPFQHQSSVFAIPYRQLTGLYGELQHGDRILNSKISISDIDESASRSKAKKGILRKNYKHVDPGNLIGLPRNRKAWICRGLEGSLHIVPFKNVIKALSLGTSRGKFPVESLARYGLTPQNISPKCQNKRMDHAAVMGGISSVHTKGSSGVAIRVFFRDVGPKRIFCSVMQHPPYQLMLEPGKKPNSYIPCD
jgi:hypothetical protein